MDDVTPHMLDDDKDGNIPEDKSTPRTAEGSWCVDPRDVQPFIRRSHGSDRGGGTMGERIPHRGSGKVEQPEKVDHLAR